MVTLVHLTSSKQTCVSIDFCERVPSAIVTKVPRVDHWKARKEQRHELIAFLSVHFIEFQFGLSIPKKEAIAVTQTTSRLHCILATPDRFDLHTDHKHLIFLFSPLSLITGLSQISPLKLHSWAVPLNSYNYVFHHIEFEGNICDTLLGRSSTPSVVHLLITISELPTAEGRDFEWAFETEMVNAQRW